MPAEAWCYGLRSARISPACATWLLRKSGGWDARSPELAPYGAAAVQALKKAGLWKAVEPKLVYGQSISVAKQFADSGNVAAAFTALALLHGVAGHYVKVDQHLYDPIEQALCIIKNNTEPDAARKFSAFLLGEAGQAILAKYGYTKPSVR